MSINLSDSRCQALVRKVQDLFEKQGVSPVDFKISVVACRDFKRAVSSGFPNFGYLMDYKWTGMGVTVELSNATEENQKNFDRACKALGIKEFKVESGETANNQHEPVDKVAKGMFLAFDNTQYTREHDDANKLPALLLQQGLSGLYTALMSIEQYKGQRPEGPKR